MTSFLRGCAGSHANMPLGAVSWHLNLWGMGQDFGYNPIFLKPFPCRHSQRTFVAVLASRPYQGPSRFRGRSGTRFPALARGHETCARDTTRPGRRREQRASSLLSLPDGSSVVPDLLLVASRHSVVGRDKGGHRGASPRGYRNIVRQVQGVRSPLLTSAR